MTDIARLGISVESAGLRRAMADLDRFGNRAERAEDDVRDLDRAMTGLGTTARTVAGAMAGLAAIGGVSVGFGEAITQALAFDAALRETTTLFAVLEGQYGDVRAAAMGLAGEFGDATGQVKAFYQAFSAGAADVEAATALIDTANRVAVGGLTDMTTSTNILSVATNAYAAAGLTAAEAGDSLFVAMRAGMTTIPELASSLGNVISIAAPLGVTFDELTAATAALTTQGVTTASSVTGLRAILSAVAAPTKQAAEAAKALGVDFSVAGLQAKGLEGFLQDVLTKTGGTAEGISALFGSVEAFSAMMAFAGGGGTAFAGILEDMADKAGAAEEAFERISQGYGERLQNVWDNIGAAMLRAGEVTLSVVVPAIEAVNDNADLAAKALGTVGAGMAVAFGPQIIASITATTAAVRALTIALAANPIGAVAVAVATATAGLILFRDEIKEAGENATGARAPLGWLAGAIGAVESAANSATSAMARLDAQVQAMQALESAPTTQAANRIAEIEQTIRMRERSLERATRRGGDAPAALRAEIDALVSERSALEEAGRILTRQFFVAPRVEVPEPVADVVDPLRRTREEVLSLIGGIGSAAAGGAGGAQRDAFAQWLASTRERTEAQRLEAEVVGMSAVQAERYRIAFDGLNAAREAGLAVTPDIVSQINQEAEALAVAMEAATTAQERFERITGAVDQFGQNLGDAFTDAIFGAKSLEDALGGVLRVAGRMAVNQVLMTLIGSASGGTGLLGALFGGLTANANGNAFSGGRVVPFALGGVVTGSTLFPMAGGRTGLMGEAGPEAIMPLARAANGRLGVMAANQNRAPSGTSQTFNFSPTIDARGADKAAVDRLQRELEHMHKNFEKRVQAFNQESQLRGTRA